MSVKINSTLVVEMRSQRAWSQQQLADIAGVSLRTVQRAEKSGRTSAESLKAIASAFDMAAAQLSLTSGRGSQQRWAITFTGVAASFALVGIMLLLLPGAVAAPLLLTVNFFAVNDRMDSQAASTWELVADFDKTSYLDVSENLRISFLPTMSVNGEPQIGIQLYQNNNGDLVPVTLQPGTLTGYDKDYRITHESAERGKLTLTVVAHSRR